MIYRSFDEIYTKILKKILIQPLEKNERTGTNCYTYFGKSLKWDLNYYPLSGIRRLFPKIAAAELAWMLSGTTKTTWLKNTQVFGINLKIHLIILKLHMGVDGNIYLE